MRLNALMDSIAVADAAMLRLNQDAGAALRAVADMARVERAVRARAEELVLFDCAMKCAAEKVLARRAFIASVGLAPQPPAGAVS